MPINMACHPPPVGSPAFPGALVATDDIYLSKCLYFLNSGADIMGGVYRFAERFAYSSTIALKMGGVIGLPSDSHTPQPLH
jgi:hypothetical protein